MPLQATSGAASYDAFGGGAVAAIPYIEDVFSAYIYTNNTYPSNLTITNGIDLSGKGGLVWMKNRSLDRNHNLYDTARGALKQLRSDSTGAEITRASGYGLTAFNANGFSLGTDIDGENVSNVVSWTFRKQPKFFDVVTYTGTGASQTVSHSLNGTVGALIIKKTSGTGNWATFTRTSGAAGSTLYAYFNSAAGLNLTAAANATGVAAEAAGIITTTSFNPNDLSGSGASGNVNNINDSGATYVAYIFAHNAGGFGLTGTDNVISCGSYTGNGSTSGPTVTLGYEPQWLLVKNATTVGNWFLMDNMRGIPMSGDTAILKANTSDVEDNNQGHAIELNATGFQVTTSFTGTNGSGDTLIYIAIRRGPMKVPTSGTSVYGAVAYSGDGTTGRKLNYGFSPDLALYQQREGNASYMNMFIDRLRGDTRQIQSWTSAAEGGFGNATVGVHLTTGPSKTIDIGVNGSYINASGSTYIMQGLGRAPGFFDEVCYTGTGATPQNITHNLGVAPELIIVKVRNDVDWSWIVYAGNAGQYLLLDTVDPASPNTNVWANTAPTSSVFRVGNAGNSNLSGKNLVAYLFATCAGVSKVFSYTGNGSSQTINCGFTGGARFVLIKRTDSTGDWYVWDSARGIVSGNDPHLSLNTTAAEVTTDDTIDTDSTGFVVNQVSATNVNVSSATYIGLAIA